VGIGLEVIEFKDGEEYCDMDVEGRVSETDESEVQDTEDEEDRVKKAGGEIREEEEDSNRDWSLEKAVDGEEGEEGEEDVGVYDEEVGEDGAETKDLSWLLMLLMRAPVVRPVVWRELPLARMLVREDSVQSSMDGSSEVAKWEEGNDNEGGVGLVPASCC
jgi:hypothetical protein